MRPDPLTLSGCMTTRLDMEGVEGCGELRCEGVRLDTAWCCSGAFARGVNHTGRAHFRSFQLLSGSRPCSAAPHFSVRIDGPPAQAPLLMSGRGLRQSG